MKPGFAFITALFLVLAFSVSGQFAVVKNDLKNEWLIHSGQQFSLQAGRPAATIYFTVELDKFAGDYLLISSSKSFSVFLNGKLVLDDVDRVKLSVDSLARVLETRVPLIAVHQEPLIETGLTTQMIAEVGIPAELDEGILKVEDSTMKDFMIAATLLVFLFLIVIFRTNPNLTSDYFSLSTFFSLRESDDHPMFNRIGNTTNILAYIFVSLVTSLLLIQVPFESDVFIKASPGNGFLDWTIDWLAGGALILAGLFLKALLIFVVCLLFNWRGLSGFHFFTFVRFLLLVFGVLQIGMVIQFFSTGSTYFTRQPAVDVVHYVLLSWVAFAFLKLMNKTSTSVIHLFLYLCATELIPFLIIIKVL